MLEGDALNQNSNSSINLVRFMSQQVLKTLFVAINYCLVRQKQENGFIIMLLMQLKVNAARVYAAIYRTKILGGIK